MNNPKNLIQGGPPTNQPGYIRSLTCEKCGGQVHRAKTFRLSGCLVTIGFAFLVPSFLVLLFVTLGMFGFIGAAGSADHDLALAHSGSLSSLERVPGIDPDFLARFRTNPDDIDPQRAFLPDDIAGQVRPILIQYAQTRNRTVLGAAGSVAIGGIFAILTYAVCLPLLIVGLLLTLRKKVWRCASCQSVFNRA